VLGNFAVQATVIATEPFTLLSVPGEHMRAAARQLGGLLAEPAES
jgi:hypothetical protein